MNLISRVTRHWGLWWTWELFEVHESGLRFRVASGGCLSRKRARASVMSWERIWLRRHGQLPL